MRHGSYGAHRLVLDGHLLRRATAPRAGAARAGYQSGRPHCFDRQHPHRARLSCQHAADDVDDAETRGGCPPLHPRTAGICLSHGQYGTSNTRCQQSSRDGMTAGEVSAVTRRRSHARTDIAAQGTLSMRGTSTRTNIGSIYDTHNHTWNPFGPDRYTLAHGSRSSTAVREVRPYAVDGNHDAGMSGTLSKRPPPLTG
jgi:hypothetical protein